MAKVSSENSTENIEYFNQKKLAEIDDRVRKGHTTYETELKNYQKDLDESI